MSTFSIKFFLLRLLSSLLKGPGLSTVDGGVVIDLRELKGIRVDTENQTVRW
jgi:hypothetical protein